MNYTIDEAGIHFHILNEHDAEERATDDIADADALAAVQRIAAKLEADFGSGGVELSAERREVIRQIVMNEATV